MKGLVKKDFLLLKGNLTYFLVVTVVFTLFSITGMAFDVLFVLPFIAIMMFISTFNYDDFNNWNAYAITLPVSRINIVKSKYISAIIILIISIILGIVISSLTAVFSKNTFDIQTVLLDISGAFLGLILVLAIWIPLIYKYGVERGRIMLFVGVFSIVTIGVIVSKLFDFTTIINFINSLENIWFIFVSIITIIILIISYLVSSKIYLKKEF